MTASAGTRFGRINWNVRPLMLIQHIVRYPYGVKLLFNFRCNGSIRFKSCGILDCHSFIHSSIHPFLTDVFFLPWLRFLFTLTEDFVYPDWGFCLAWLRFLFSLTGVFVYPDWGFCLVWLRFLFGLTEVFVYPDLGFCLPWLKILFTLTEDFVYPDWGFCLPWLRFLFGLTDVFV
jgi:hypothetical protein